MTEMEEIIVRKIDPQGRISIPMQRRNEWKSSKVALIKRENRIEIAPIEPTSPPNLFDDIEISENVDFVDPHSLRKALRELQER